MSLVVLHPLLTGAQSPQRYSIDDLYTRLVAAERAASIQFEAHLERTGNVIVVGRVAAIDHEPGGAVSVWLGMGASLDLVGRFLFARDVATRTADFRVGHEAAFACGGLYRSYALVRGLCE